MTFAHPSTTAHRHKRGGKLVLLPVQKEELDVPADHGPPHPVGGVGAGDQNIVPREEDGGPLGGGGWGVCVWIVIWAWHLGGLQGTH